jgi:hypothetical protein
MKVSGFALLVLGLIVLIYVGIGYNRQGTGIDLGPIQAKATKQESIPISPILGAFAVIGGILLLARPRRRLTVTK